jgi:hypothetical protein
LAARTAGDALPKEGKRQESSSFLKKRTKKLLLSSSACRRVNQKAKVFCFFLSKKKYFLASPKCHSPPGSISAGRGKGHGRGFSPR